MTISWSPNKKLNTPQNIAGVSVVCRINNKGHKTKVCLSSSKISTINNTFHTATNIPNVCCLPPSKYKARFHTNMKH